MPRSYPFSEPIGLELDPTYAELRTQCPVSRVRFPNGGEGWLAASYETVKAVLTDARFSRSAAVNKDVPRLSPLHGPRSLLTLDPPDHTWVRRLLSVGLTPRHIQNLRPQTQQVVDRLLDGLQPPADVSTQFSLPLAITATCDLMGIPRENHEVVHHLIDGMSRMTQRPEQHAAVHERLSAFCVDLIESRRREPVEDLIGLLVKAQDEVEGFTDEELVMLIRLFIIAGVDTTANQLSNSVYALLTHPDQLALLRARPELYPGAVEELLRFVPLTTGSFTRVATADVEIAGVTVPAGDGIMVSLPSANRDESAFAEPNRLDLTRDRDNRHVAFGHGPHHCPGSQLARMVLQTALRSFVERLPTVRLAEPVSYVPSRQTLWPEAVVVSW